MSLRSFGSDVRGYLGQSVSLAGGTVTASGAGAPVATEQAHTLRLTLNVTAASGTGQTLDVRLEQSQDGTTWTTHSAFTQATAAGTQRKMFTGLDRFVRVAWTVGGTTPSFTFTVRGEAV